MENNLKNITRFWNNVRNRLSIESFVELSLTELQLHSLLCEIEPNEVQTYRINWDDINVIFLLQHALEINYVPASLIEAIDEVRPNFDEDICVELDNLIAQTTSDSESSLETKVSAAEIILLYGTYDFKESTLTRLGDSIDNEMQTVLPERVQIALGLVGALTGKYLLNIESNQLVEYLDDETYTPAIELLNRWNLHDALWTQVHTSAADKERDTLLRKLHESYPNTDYKHVIPDDFVSQEIPALEERVGRQALLHLANIPSGSDWSNHISNLNLGICQTNLLDLLFQARPNDRALFIDKINHNLRSVNQVTFTNNISNSTDGYISLFDLKTHNIHFEFPDVFYYAATSILLNGGYFDLSKLPNPELNRIQTEVWSRIVAGDTKVSASILRDFIGPHIKDIYNKGGKEQFTQYVLPRIIRSSNPENLEWAIEFLFSRHRSNSTIPENSVAIIQSAIDDVYPHSTQDVKSLIDYLARKKWFSLPPHD